MRRSLLAVLLLVAVFPGVARSGVDSNVRAGYGEADSTGTIGSGSGQYTDQEAVNLQHLATGGEVDPFSHSWLQTPSYGVASRLTYRAIVVEGNNGRRAAFVKADHYLASDALTHRVGQILDAAGTSGIHYADIMMMATHNHSSPMYTSPSWGVWLFQDVFDLRRFEFEARQMALAIERAAADLRPARMGATVIRHTIYKGNIAGATIGDDGTPAGYPDSHADFNVSVVRFDEVPSGNPIAVLVNHGQHPESLDGYDLITADYLGPLQRMIKRDLGTNLVWSQGDVGSAEGPYCNPGQRPGHPQDDDCRDVSQNDVLPDGVTRAWAHVGHAQTERGARYLADAIEAAYADISDGNALVPFTTDFPVAVGNLWAPPPVSHPYPSVSNCRTEPTVEGNPGVPIIGLPDCSRELGNTDDNASQLWEQLKGTGLPLPEHYDAPSFGAVEENLRLHLQAIRLGEVLFASCACEAQMDLILNFESRANDVTGDIFDGYEYPCTQNTDTTWNCQAGRQLDQTVTITNAQHARMVAEVHNDAKGWDDPANAIASNAESLDPSKIFGNFTKEELPANLGYKLPIGVGHAGDYNGYVVSYREYMIRDHYRKALTAYGPHTADYMVTRMVRLAGFLKGGPTPAGDLLDPVATVDATREEVFTTALGTLSSTVYDAWIKALPNDVGPAAAVTQPEDITRFDAATFTWRGGSNAHDTPVARVEKLEGTAWVPFADQSGEVQTMVKLPDGLKGFLDAWSGRHEWLWTANFEAFDAFPRTAVPGGQTPLGTYRFVVDGQSRAGGVDTPYHFESDPFIVSRYGGLTASDPQRDATSLSFVVAGTYPRSYTSPFRYINDDGNPVICRTCSFRPWAQHGEITGVMVHIVHSGGGTSDVAASLVSGRWVVSAGSGDTVTIEPGGITDEFGETNGTQISF